MTYYEILAPALRAEYCPVLQFKAESGELLVNKNYYFHKIIEFLA